MDEKTRSATYNGHCLAPRFPTQGPIQCCHRIPTLPTTVMKWDGLLHAPLSHNHLFLFVVVNAISGRFTNARPLDCIWVPLPFPRYIMQPAPTRESGAKKPTQCTSKVKWIMFPTTRAGINMEDATDAWCPADHYFHLFDHLPQSLTHAQLENLLQCVCWLYSC